MNETVNLNFRSQASNWILSNVRYLHWVPFLRENMNLKSRALGRTKYSTWKFTEYFTGRARELSGGSIFKVVERFAGNLCGTRDPTFQSSGAFCRKLLKNQWSNFPKFRSAFQETFEIPVIQFSKFWRQARDCWVAGSWKTWHTAGFAFSFTFFFWI